MGHSTPTTFLKLLGAPPHRTHPTHKQPSPGSTEGAAFPRGEQGRALRAGWTPAWPSGDHVHAGCFPPSSRLLTCKTDSD